MRKEHEEAYQIFRDLIIRLKELNVADDIRSRELSVAITELETSAMWFNKHRAIKGHLNKSETHIVT